MSDFFSSYATGGATRPDSFTGMNTGFSSALQSMISAAPANIQSGLQITSGYRSPARQAQIYSDAVAKYGSPQAARAWAAPPGKSQHNKGFAADLKYASDEAKSWVRDNAPKYGLSFPLSNEPWHIELASARQKAVQPKAVIAGPLDEQGAIRAASPLAGRSRMPGATRAATLTGLGMPSVPAAPAQPGLLDAGGFLDRNKGAALGTLLGTAALGPAGGLIGGLLGDQFSEMSKGRVSTQAKAAFDQGWDGFSAQPGPSGYTTEGRLPSIPAAPAQPGVLSQGGWMDRNSGMMLGGLLGTAALGPLGGLLGGIAGNALSEGSKGSMSNAASAAMNAGWDGFSGMSGAQMQAAQSAGTGGGSSGGLLGSIGSFLGGMFGGASSSSGGWGQGNNSGYNGGVSANLGRSGGGGVSDGGRKK
ncbi:hypothetical protein GCM10011390_50400 [Aureimonas endophytica]|uniref:D-alanyl-D-alanine carboxypeptidase-like core domain-containing protein n=1 Tax=Aureimonas endophytica TaxID=2027858 RepID=A0A917ECT0_9HYPH|nr:M15 family metallopeptidase [Aureimonas endophytica]GGE24884.1 hypothetical protein GCM10011390_50400 [Aureimonas endophytica]